MQKILLTGGTGFVGKHLQGEFSQQGIASYAFSSTQYDLTRGERADAVFAANDWSFCGVAAEISAQITESCFADLKAPPSRIGFAPVPCPTTRPFKTLFYTSAKNIVREVGNLLRLPEIDLSGEIFNEYERRFMGPF